jgi:hypothetical protein
VKNKDVMKTGEKVKVSPELTGLGEWIEGMVIKIRKNPFLGVEIAIKDSLGRIFFGEERYFKTLS